MRFLFYSKLAVPITMADYSQSYSGEIDVRVLIRCAVKRYQECIFKEETGDVFTVVKEI